MPTIRIQHSKNYTCIANSTLKDDRLSFRARGILAFLLSHPDGWQVNSTHLASKSPSEKKTAIRTALTELEAYGYLFRQKIRNAKGQIEWETCVAETPQPPQKLTNKIHGETRVRSSSDGSSSAGQPERILSNEIPSNEDQIPPIVPQSEMPPTSFSDNQELKTKSKLDLREPIGGDEICEGRGVFSEGEESLDLPKTTSSQETAEGNECGIDSPLPTPPPRDSGYESEERSSAPAQKSYEGDEAIYSANPVDLAEYALEVSKSAAKERPLTDEEMDDICYWLATSQQLKLTEFQLWNNGKVYWPWKTTADKKSQDFDTGFVRWLSDNKFSTTPDRNTRTIRSREWIRNRSVMPKPYGTQEIVQAWYAYQAEVLAKREREKPISSPVPCPKEIRSRTHEEVQASLNAAVAKNPELADFLRKVKTNKAKKRCL